VGGAWYDLGGASEATNTTREAHGQIHKHAAHCNKYPEGGES